MGPSVGDARLASGLPSPKAPKRPSRGRKRRILPWALSGALVLAPSLRAGPLSGQTMLGARLGASVSSLAEVDDAGVGNRTGFAAGVFLERPVSPRFSLQAEGAYVQKGASFEDATLELDYVELAAYLKTGTSGRLSVHAFAGPAVGINASCRVSADLIAGIVTQLFGGDVEEGPCDALDNEIVVETFDFGAKGGVGVAVGESSRWSLEVAYTLGLRDIRRGDKNRAFLIQAGAAFPVG